MGQSIRRSSVFIGLLGSLLSLFDVSAHAATPLVDPMEWTKPASPPEFRKVLSDDEFQKRFDAAWKEIGDIAELEKSTTPPIGQLIVSVTPDSTAESQGIRVGDVFTHCNDEVMWEQQAFDHFLDGERNIRVVTAAGEVRTVKFPTGTVGIVRTSIWRPELQYLRSNQRDTRWDRDVVAGVLMRDKDPELAETCWARAIESGYTPDDRSAVNGALIALNSGRSDSAADFAFPLFEEGHKNDESVHPKLLYRVAVANYKLKHALVLIENSPTALDPDIAITLRKLVSLHEGRSPEERCLPTPSQLAETMYRDDFRKSCVSLNSHPRATYNAEKFQASPKITLKSPTDRDDPLCVGPPQPAKNLELRVRFRMKSTDNETGHNAKQLSCAFMDAEFWDFPERSERSQGLLLSAVIYQDYTTYVSSGDLAAFSVGKSQNSDNSKQEQTIRLVRVNGQGEAFINGHRLIYAPVYDDVNFVSVAIHSLGMEVDILDLEVVELIERL